MAITKAVGFKASDGVVYATVEEAQAAELRAIFGHSNIVRNEDMSDSDVFAQAVLKNVDAVLAALTIGPRTRPKARKAAGTTNPKRAAKRATPEQAQAGFTAMRIAVAEPEPIGAD
jgi:hypothetical protein